MAPLPNNPSKQLQKGMEIFDSSLIWLIIGAIGIIIASVLVSYLINRTLVKRLSRQMKMDRGIEFAIQKVTQYVLVGIGIYTAFAFVGLPVSAFAGIFALLLPTRFSNPYGFGGYCVLCTIFKVHSHLNAHIALRANIAFSALSFDKFASNFP